MNPLLPSFGVLSGLLLSSSSVLANPASFECRGAIRNLDRAQTIVQTNQRDEDKAKRELQVAESDMEVCQPGGIVTGAKIAECARKRENLPIARRAAVDAATKFGESIADFQKSLDTVLRVCQ